jgi:ribonuclease R
VARSSRPVAGRFHTHRDGYGFVTPDEAQDGDLFIPSGRSGGAMHGDRVEVRVTGRDRRGRLEGEVVRVLRRAHPTVVGEFRAGRRGGYVIPFDDRLHREIAIPPGGEIPRESARDRIGARAVEARDAAGMDGLIVDVEVVRFPRDDEPAAGRVIEILGRRDDFGVDVEMVIRKHHIPHRFPVEALEEAHHAPGGIRAEDLAGRSDFRAFPVVTIDGETARDFDDAVWVDLLGNGHFALHVHIADVSHYVRPGTAIDAEARLRGTSVYFPDRAIPMLPLELSTEICSLKPGVDRLVLSALLEIDRQGRVVEQAFRRGVIRSVERMTYTGVHALLEGDAPQRARYAALVPMFERMRELALILNRRRERRGSIDFDLPEALIEFDEFGEMTGVSRGPRNIAHRIIEEFMLAANEAVASHIAASGAPGMYRVHERPDPERVFEFEEIAARFGVSLTGGALPVHRHAMVDRKRAGRKMRRDLTLPAGGFQIGSRHYRELIAKIAGRPEERILHYLMLRSLKQARYSEEKLGHFALASDCYTHFTSPIRRYPDLIVHRVLVALLDRAKPPYEDAHLAAVAAESSETERRAAAAERELVEWKKLKFMSDRLGDEFEALIISTQRFGFFVELEEYFVEGLVPIDTLPGGRWMFHEARRRIHAQRGGREFAIGDRVRVRLDRVNVLEKKLEFSVR